jgi:ubiquinone/menaquinone biosynthesis C-methylase UbiE
MNVLDVGCGTAEVTLMRAEAVGPAGSVRGIDRPPEALEKGRDRAALRGAEHVRFVENDIATLTADEPYGAVVGRMVLMQQPDPAAALARLVGLAGPGGSWPSPRSTWCRRRRRCPSGRSSRPWSAGSTRR